MTWVYIKALAFYVLVYKLQNGLYNPVDYVNACIQPTVGILSYLTRQIKSAVGIG